MRKNVIIDDEADPLIALKLDMSFEMDGDVIDENQQQISSSIDIQELWVLLDVGTSVTRFTLWNNDGCKFGGILR